MSPTVPDLQLRPHRAVRAAPRHRPGTVARRVRKATLLSLLAILSTACGPGTADDDATGEARTYTLRGAVRGTEGELTLQHEAIPDFVGPGGEVEPMHAMTMSFPVAPDLDLGGLTPGDPVEIRLRVDWSASPPTLVTAVEALPEGTELDLAGPS
jgi:Cu/Ag efflux protein CusF